MQLDAGRRQLGENVLGARQRKHNAERGWAGNGRGSAARSAWPAVGALSIVGVRERRVVVTVDTHIVALPMIVHPGIVVLKRHALR
jgi:hypothetical protein